MERGNPNGRNGLKNIHKKYDNNDVYSVTDFNLDADREFISFSLDLLVAENQQRFEWSLV